MSTRFVTGAALVLGGGFLVAASLAFAPAITAWLAFAIASGAIALLAAAQLDTARGLAQRAMDGVAGALAVLTLIFSLVFTGTAVQWLMFAFAVGFVALGYVGLTVNEIGEWRAEHGLAPLHGLRLVHGDREHRLAA
jgi:O-antigen/teichoic acid export membrane protein